MSAKKKSKSNEAQTISIPPELKNMTAALRNGCEAASLERRDNQEAVLTGVMTAKDANDQRGDTLDQLTDQKHQVVDTIKANKNLSKSELTARLEDKIIPETHTTANIRSQLK